MAAITFDALLKVEIREQIRTGSNRFRSMLDAFISNRMQEAATEASYLRPRQTARSEITERTAGRSFVQYCGVKVVAQPAASWLGDNATTRAPAKASTISALSLTSRRDGCRSDKSLKRPGAP
jgi:hypothetical protein